MASINIVKTLLEFDRLGYPLLSKTYLLCSTMMFELSRSGIILAHWALYLSAIKQQRYHLYNIFKDK